METSSGAGLPSKNCNDLNLKLFENVLNDPLQRSLILKLLTSKDQNVFEIFRNKPDNIVKSPVKKIKQKNHCESPTALLRRRELEKVSRPDSRQSNISKQSSSSGRTSVLPFEKILMNVIAYVEIKSNGNDRSAGAKALLKSMGATVLDQFTKNVTHVIFKDGSYQTYQRAKLLKVHFVSVLWLEATRQNGIRASEKSYPALGTKNYDPNVSMICYQMQKDYEDVIRKEIRHSLESGSPLPSTKSLMESRRRTIGSKEYDKSSQLLIENEAENTEVEQILSKIRGQSESQKHAGSSLVLGNISPMSLDEDLTDLTKTIKFRLETKSPNSSVLSCGSSENNRSNISNSDCQSALLKANFSKNLIIDDTFVNKTPLRSNEVSTSNMDFTCNGDEDSDSASLISHRFISGRSSRNLKPRKQSSNFSSRLAYKKQQEEDIVDSNILENLGKSQSKSISDTSTRAQNSGHDFIEKISCDEKENFNTPKPDQDNVIEEEEFYNLKTLKMKDRKKSKRNVLQSKTNLMEKIYAGIFDEQSIAKEVIINTRSSSRISGCSEAKKFSKQNEMDSPEITSLFASSDSSIQYNGTPKSSLKLNRTRTYKSNPTNIDIESNEEKDSPKQESNEERPPASTPFVTVRKRKKGVDMVVIENSEEPSKTNVAKTAEVVTNKTNSEILDSGKDILSSLNISDNSKENKSTRGIKRRSSEMSPLHISADSNNHSTGTSMSSLKLCKTSMETSNASNMSSLRVSSEHRNIEVENNAKKYTDSENNKSQAMAPTSFLSGANKKSTETFDENSLVPEENINVRLKNDNKKSSKIPLISTRSLRKRSLAQNRKTLPGREIVYNENKEIELHPREEVHTEKSRKSFENVSDEEQNCSNRRSDIRKRTRFSRRKSTKLGKSGYTSESSQNELDEKQETKNGLTGNLQKSNTDEFIGEENTENSIENGNIQKKKVEKSKGIISRKTFHETSVIRNETEKPSATTRKSAIEKKPVIILENILVPPEGNTYVANESVTKQMGKADRKDVIPAASKSDDNITTLESSKKPVKVKSNEMGNFKISRSKSETDILSRKSTLRKSRRIRKLYDPDDVALDKDIHRKIQVDDTKEREAIRREKVTEVNTRPESSFITGNVLLTKKAMEFLERNEKNQKELKQLFKSPESVLDQLCNKKKVVEKKNESMVDYSSDEQIELAEELLHKKLKGLSQPRAATQGTPVTRRSIRIVSQKALTTDSRKRRSTMEFQPNSLRFPKVKTKLKLEPKPTIVCTKMHKPDVQIFNQIVKKLGTFDVENEVTCRTTHLVAGELKRTINLLRALARGCWILKKEWLFNSLEQGTWLPEEKYEASEFSPAVQKCRLERIAFGPSYTMNIFLHFGPIFVAKSTTPCCSDLKELIVLCKGKVTKAPQIAHIVVGTYLEGCKCVNEYWVLDSISGGKLKPWKKYLISKETISWMSKVPSIRKE